MFTQSYVDSWCLFPAGNPPPLWLIYDTFMGNLHSGSINLMSHLIMLHLRKEIAEPKRIQLYLGRVWGDKGVSIPRRGEGAQWIVFLMPGFFLVLDILYFTCSFSKINLALLETHQLYNSSEMFDDKITWGVCLSAPRIVIC